MVYPACGKETKGFRGDFIVKMTYTVSQDDKSKLWYAHRVNYPYIPVFGSFRKTRKGALQCAADSMGLPLEDYMELRNRKGVKS